MGLQDWGAIRSDGHSATPQQEAVFWQWGKRLSPWLMILVAIYAAFSYMVKHELHEVELKLSTHSIAIQHLQNDMKVLRHDMAIVKKDMADVKASLAKIEGYLIKHPTP